MPTLTIRNLPDAVHARLRERAEAAQVSVEGYVRRCIAADVAAADEEQHMSPTGFADASQAFIHAAAQGSAAALPDLWGALRGSVLVSPDVDVTAPTGKTWSALG